MMIWTLVIFCSYLLGSIPTGYLIGKYIYHVDIRTKGSGNVGATNVFRVLGRRPGIFTLTVDILKGILPVAWIQQVYPHHLLLALGAGLAAIVGHTTSPFLGFKGGKGVATSAGAFIALLPIASSVAIATFLITLFLSGYVSVSSMLAAVVLAICAIFTAPHPALYWAAIVIAAFVFWTHRSNLRRLRTGTENKVSWKYRSSSRAQ